MLKVICQHYLSLKQREDAKSVSENFSVFVGAFMEIGRASCRERV
mgnify:CR=1 FL=1